MGLRSVILLIAFCLVCLFIADKYSNNKSAAIRETTSMAELPRPSSYLPYAAYTPAGKNPYPEQLVELRAWCEKPEHHKDAICQEQE